MTQSPPTPLVSDRTKRILWLVACASAGMILGYEKSQRIAWYDHLSDSVAIRFGTMIVLKYTVGSVIVGLVAGLVMQSARAAEAVLAIALLIVLLLLALTG